MALAGAIAKAINVLATMAAIGRFVILVIAISLILDPWIVPRGDGPLSAEPQQAQPPGERPRAFHRLPAP